MNMPQPLEEAPLHEAGPPVEFRVFLAPGVEAAIEAHAASEPNREICGALFGRPGRDPSGLFVLVSRAVVGKFADQRGVSVTFTHKTWDYIYSELAAGGDGLSIVGWYHSHPGFGVFYSAYDSFIQQNFFGQSWQIGIVIDPSTGARGAFANTETSILGQVAYWNLAEDGTSTASVRHCEYRDRVATQEPEPQAIGELVAAAGEAAEIIGMLRCITDTMALTEKKQRRLLAVTWSALTIALLTMGVAIVILVRIIHIEVKENTGKSIQNSARSEGENVNNSVHSGGG